MASILPIPPNYASTIPYLTIKGAAKAIDFYQKAYGAELISRMDMPDGAVMHAEMRIGAALFMLSEQSDEWCSKSPDMLGDSPVSLMIYVEDVDALVKQATAAGAKLSIEVADQFWGDRSSCLVDPFGHRWMFATHTEDLTDAEIAERAKKMFGQ
ncbi:MULTISPECIES: VOC family protein [unclassified Arsukibacterium]|uniref:VOC family protein n=1 Tax=unclassified Arsukibacterium TaxID=2635278 RepID=UPI000C9863BB|nr:MULTISPECIES: VOC family protein [unclassified Arsukibacterium]MAA96527.1 glyoxalase [Rheinheimera sp.]HAW94228.1 glyoxalase [Candidatus Azambacteria bacterium]|tara:strand:+ start:1307 stop:1771 length:465 start_codon:yes stop_codon:yes gene_type:complete